MSVTFHTTLGDVKMEVYCDSVPRIAENFLAHCAAGTYDGTIFHRNIKNFMVQGGDPTNTGKGGESIWGGKIKDQFDERLRHNKRGIVSMASKGPDTIGSQFFILYDNAPHLNNVYCVVGEIIHGFDVLDAMEKVPVTKKNKPETEIKVRSVTMHANPLAGV